MSTSQSAVVGDANIEVVAPYSRSVGGSTVSLCDWIDNLDLHAFDLTPVESFRGGCADQRPIWRVGWKGIMKALVTGAAGFVGPHLVNHLRSCGDTVMAYNRKNGPDLRDCASWTDLLATDKPDVLYHLGGWSDVASSWRDPINTFADNAFGTTSILEAARLAETERVLVVSSADVYGAVDGDNMPITEDQAARPRSPYGASKLAAEASALQYWLGFGLGAIVVRPFNHLGPGQGTQFVGPALASQIANAEAGGTVEISHGNLDARRDVTDVRDVVRAYRLLATYGQSGEVYNICSNLAVKMQYILDALIERSPMNLMAVQDPALIRPVELPVLQGSYSKLHACTGWEPHIELEATLDDVLNHARNRR